MLTLSCVNHYFVFTSVVVSVLKLGVAELNTGDSCSLASGSPGLCKFLTDCAPALKLVNEGPFPTDLCNSGDSQFVVCCEDTNPVTTPPPEPVRQEVPEPAIVTEYTVIERKAGEISQKKCKEYAKYVWDRSRSPTLSGGGPHYSDTFECPFDKLPLIVGGVYASRQEFPHMVLIGFNKGQEVEWSCGGSLISENYVLTASHCLRSGRMGLAKLIRIGMTNQSDTSHMQELTISEVMYHRDYDFSSKYHDIALMKLSKNVDLNTFARPACLHTGKELPTKRAIATGWGNLGFSAEASNDLMKVVLEFFDHASCNHTYRRKIKRGDSEIKRGILDDLQICAGSHQEPKDTCQGDSGGPLQIYHNDSDGAHCMYDIVGVTSFGKACGLVKNSPGVYVRVSNYIKWIEDVVWPEQS